MSASRTQRRKSGGRQSNSCIGSPFVRFFLSLVCPKLSIAEITNATTPYGKTTNYLRQFTNEEAMPFISLVYNDTPGLIPNPNGSITSVLALVPAITVSTMFALN